MLRLPDGMRERIADQAKANRRSMNTEIVTLLEQALESRKSFADLVDQLDRIAGMVMDHDRKLNPKNWD